MILVTGAAGFIGSHFVVDWLAEAVEPVLAVDKLTYAGDLENLQAVRDDPRLHFVQEDICNGRAIAGLLAQHRPRALLNFAAESHVDRSIDDAAVFVQTNVVGTFELLRAARHHLGSQAERERRRFRFLQVSTDEVFGSLDEGAAPVNEDRPYAPRNPYAASKAAADHLVASYGSTHGLPTLITRSSNNYGPRQHEEKLIPQMVARALRGEPLGLYGDGRQCRDWLHVSDHCAALRRVLADGEPGTSYNIGAGNERRNVDLVRALCAALDRLVPGSRPSESLILHVPDRPGHDRRYTMDCARVRQLGWSPRVDFDTGLAQTVAWYVARAEGRAAR
jgi:dTDP-glucose 4,6-dehydratase